MYKKSTFFSLILPALIIFTIVILIPTIMGITLSFTDWQRGQELFTQNWIGFDNYKTALQDGEFLNSLGYTSVFTIIALFLVNFIGFTLAYLLTLPFKGKNFFRGVFFLPNLIGGLVLGFLWQIIFDRVFVEIFGGDTIRLENAYTSMLAMSLVYAWQMAGYVMVIYIAAFQSIDKTLKEAAKIEGAGFWRNLRTVIIPSIMPAITICFFIVLNGSFKMFDQNLAVTGGKFGTRLVAYEIYFSAFLSTTNTFGVAQAKSVIFTVIVSAIAITQVSISKRMEVQN